MVCSDAGAEKRRSGLNGERRRRSMIDQKTRVFVKHVKGMFQPTLLREIRAFLNKVEAERQALAQSERERQAVSRGETSDALRMDVRWYDVWRSPSSLALKTVGPFTWVVYPPQVRLVREKNHFVPWHQDIGYQKMLGPRAHKRLITCFIPIDDDPAKRTTLQFAREEMPELKHVPMDRFGAGLENPNFKDLAQYELELGDALVFGDLTFHRTFVPPQGIVERRSLEFRLIQPSDALENKDYFDSKSGFFVRKDGSKREQL